MMVNGIEAFRRLKWWLPLSIFLIRHKRNGVLFFSLLLLFFNCTFYVPSLKGQNFEYVGFGPSLQSVKIKDNNAVGVGQGVMVYSEDKGNTWKLADFSSPGAITLNDVDMATTLIGWAVGNDGLIYKTTDGGKSWQIQNLNGIAKKSKLRGVSAVNENIIYVVGESVTGANLNSTNTGSITSVAIGSPYPNFNTIGPLKDSVYLGRSFSSTPFLPGLNNAAFGNVVVSGGVVTSVTITSSGSGFYQGQQIYIPRNQFLPTSTVTAAASSLIFTVTNISSPSPSPFVNTPILLKSIDGGTTWTNLFEDRVPNGINHLRSSAFNDVQFLNDKVGYVVGNVDGLSIDGSGGKILKTIDGGLTWTVTTLYDEPSKFISNPASNPASISLKSIFIYDENTIYVSGSQRILYKSIDRGNTWVMKQSTNSNIPGLTSLTGIYGELHACHPDTLILANMGEDLSNYSSLISTDGGTTFVRNVLSNGVTNPNALDGNGRYITMVGLGGSISNSNDCGKTFIPIATTKIGGVLNMFFPSKNIGYAFGNNGKVYKTLDGGTTWDNPVVGGGNAGTNATIFQSGFFFNNDKGILVGSEQSGTKISTTQNGGVTWVDESLKVLGANLYDIYFPTPNIGWAVGNTTNLSNNISILYKSIDGGTNWIAQPFPVAPSIKINQGTTVYFSDSNNGYIGGVDGIVYKTNNGGASWTRLDLMSSLGISTNTAINDVWFFDQNIGYVVGTNGLFATTKNGGLTWNSTAIVNPVTNTREDGSIIKMEWLDSKEGYIVGAKGIQYYTIDGGITFQRFTPVASIATSIASSPSWPYKNDSLDIDNKLLVGYSPILSNSNINKGSLGIVGANAEKYYLDKDGDGFGDGSKPFIISFVPKKGYANNPNDCDDNSISILDYPSSPLVCRNKINISLDTTCKVNVTLDMVLEQTLGCSFNYSITIDGIINTLITKPGSYSIKVQNLKSGNSCETQALVEDKMPPILKCDTIKNVCTFSAIQIRLPRVIECNEYTLSKTIETNSNICGLLDSLITYRARDKYGNESAPCVQKIIAQPMSIDSIIGPLTKVELSSCEGIISPEHIAKSIGDSSAYPLAIINNKALPIKSNVNCNIQVSYKDDFQKLCGTGCNGGSKIFRTWTLTDICKNTSITFNQVIIAADVTGPTFTTFDDTVALSPFECKSEYLLKRPIDLKDNCDPNPKWSIVPSYGISISGNAQVGFKIIGLVPGPNLINILAEDCCGNTTSKAMTIYSLDKSGPNVILNDNIKISLIENNTIQSSNKGIARLYVKDIDNGSFDNCGSIKLEIRRPLGAPRCDNVGANSRNNNVTFNNNSSGNGITTWAHPDDANGDTDNGEYIVFCCEDLINDSLEVIVRGWDDANKNGIAGDNLIINGLRDNYNEVSAFIGISLKIKPTISCPPNAEINCTEDPLISRISKNINGVNFQTGTPTFNSICSASSIFYQDVVIENQCGVSKIERTFTGNNRGDSLKCTQTINIKYPSSWFVENLNNKIINVNLCDIKNEDFIKGNSLHQYKPLITSSSCDLIAENIIINEFNIDGGDCKKWKVDFSYINWCNGQQQKTSAYFVYRDTIKPIIECLPDEQSNNTNSNQCGSNVILSAKATDILGCNGSAILKWEIKVDINNDNIIDKIFSSDLPSSNASYIKPTISGQSINLPSVFISNSSNTHKVSWKVFDACGNFNTCDKQFIIEDKKAPTPYCLDATTILMNTGEIELWAKDFNKDSYDNCTAKDQLIYTFNNEQPVLSKLKEIHYFKGTGSVASEQDYKSGKAQKWLPNDRTSGKLFTCKNLTESQPIKLKMTVWDEKGNNEFCELKFSLVDNKKICEEVQKVYISGNVKTELGEGVENTKIILTSIIDSLNQLSKPEGYFEFTNLPKDIDYVIKGSKRDEWLNGVSTLDLIHIQRHILGVNRLGSGYKLIAADVNNDLKITASDLVALRNTILGITESFPNNDSWRYLDSSTIVSNESPWPVDEVIEIKAGAVKMTNQNFIGVKIGDVDNTASGSIKHNVLSLRKDESVKFIIQDKSFIEKEIIEIPISAMAFDQLHGFQFTLNSTLELLTIKSGSIQMTQGNFAKINDKYSTFSWFSDKPIFSNDKEEILFTLIVKATSSGLLSGHIKLSSDITRKEAYVNNNLESVPLEMIFQNNNKAENYILHQNVPNPFIGETTIRYEVQQATKVKFTFYDNHGKTILTKNTEAVKGINSILINKEEFNSRGVIYYTMDADKFKDTKQMIFIE
jgi:photosystem II stability/assembly factor-like uncharacterized protein